MFDDPKKELQRLEKQLLKEEEEEWLDQQLQEAHAMLGDTPAQEDMDATRVFRPVTQEAPVRNFANGYGGQPQAPVRQVPVQRTPEPQPKQKGLGGLVVLACLELLGIAAIIGYWVLMIL